ncbi:hypothetical protein HSX37_14210|nr:hypothetical protein [Dendrosporobacter quercicolus]NSL49185.1 hypothetical protein [Dendrosporobacter quercicolus DSM 1736]
MMQKKQFVLTGLLTFMIMLFPLLTGAATVNITVNETSPAVDTFGVSPATGSGAYIDWSQKVIIAKGIGAPAEGSKSPVLRKGQALTAAKVVAQRNLLEAIQGANVLSTTIIHNNQLIKDEIITSVQGVIKGAIEIDRKDLGGDIWEVTLAIPMYPNVSQAVIGTITEHTPRQPLPVPSSDAVRPAAPGETASGSSPADYTGLVVETAGLPLNRTFSPVIYDDTGRAIYGHMNIDPQFAISYGMVDYAATAEDIYQVDAGLSRAGKKPLIIKAWGLRDNDNNLIISKADADRLLAANTQSGDFLSKCNVVFKQ